MFKRLDIQQVFSIIILVPCFVALPIIGYDIYESWIFEKRLIWSESFTSLTICAVLGCVAGLGIFLRLKWARIIALVLFITGMLIWFIIFAIEFSNRNSHTPALSLLLLIYGICICILLFFNGDLMDETADLDKGYHDILDK
ncbi:MAG: hypothetical protein ACJAUH_002029 [Saprospiraceae bacterium]